MSYDIVTHLERLGSGASDDHSIASEGAEEILRLRAEVEKLRALLDVACDYCGTLTSGERYAGGEPVCSGCAVFDWRNSEDKRGEGES